MTKRRAGSRRVALVTESRYERPESVDEYVKNIIEEDRLLRASLAAVGIESERVAWSRPDVDWAGYDAAILRTPWDYWDHYEAFAAWLDHVAAKTLLLNDLKTLRWNVDKHYLADLEREGVAITPTRFVEQGEDVSLGAVLAECGWEQAVLKPAVSGAARETHRIDGDVAELEPTFRRLVQQEAMLVQPFLADVLVAGEVTVMAVDGETCHAVRKRPKPGDFRVQDDHGGTVEHHEPADDELALARQALAACDPLPLYGRVDMLRDATGQSGDHGARTCRPGALVSISPADDGSLRGCARASAGCVIPLLVRTRIVRWRSTA